MSDPRPSKALEVFRKQESPKIPTVRVSALLSARLESKAKKTRAAYARDYECFRAFVGESDVDTALLKLVMSPGDVAMTVVLAFQNDLLEQGLSPATVNRRLSAIRGAVQIAREAQLTSVVLNVDHLDPEEGARDSRGPGMDAIRRVIEVCDQDVSPGGVRDSLMLRWMIMIGLRRNEIRELMMRHVILDGEETGLRVRQKGKRRLHLIRLPPEVMDLAKPWLSVRGTDPGAMFCSLDRSRVTKRARLNPTAINKIVRKRAIAAGFEDAKLPDGRSFKPHGFRHTAITRVIRKHGLAAAQAFARHANPATTQRYHDDKEQLSMAAQSFMFEEV